MFNNANLRRIYTTNDYRALSQPPTSPHILLNQDTLRVNSPESQFLSSTSRVSSPSDFNFILTKFGLESSRNPESRTIDRSNVKSVLGSLKRRSQGNLQTMQIEKLNNDEFVENRKGLRKVEGFQNMIFQRFFAYTDARFINKKSGKSDIVSSFLQQTAYFCNILFHYTLAFVENAQLLKYI